MMNKYFIASCFSCIAALPILAEAQQVTFTTTMNNYRGEGAYAAIYLADAQGNYEQTLWVAGEKRKYYRSLKAWARGSQMSASEYDGLTGASWHSGRTYSFTADIPDSMINSGYQIMADTSVEHAYDVSPDIAVPLLTANDGKPFSGKTYISSLQFEL